MFSLILGHETKYLCKNLYIQWISKKSLEDLIWNMQLWHCCLSSNHMQEKLSAMLGGNCN